MKSVLVLLSATAALADSGTNTPDGDTQDSLPVTSLTFTIIFGVVLLVNIVWLIKAIKVKRNIHDSDIEKESLMNAKLPEGVVSTNISVSVKNRPSLLGELRHDEHLVWANENLTPVRSALLILLSMSLLFAATGFATALSFMFSFSGESDAVFLSIWLPLILMNFLFLMLAVVIEINSSSHSVIYALTSKRVFIFSLSPGCCGGKIETVRAYDLDGIHQTTVTRKEDGSGTLTFSAAALSDGVAYQNPEYTGLFAFINIPNVTEVKNMVEQYKTLRKKEAGNQ